MTGVPTNIPLTLTMDLTASAFTGFANNPTGLSYSVALNIARLSNQPLDDDKKALAQYASIDPSYPTKRYTN